MTISKAKTILRKDISCFKVKCCDVSCDVCGRYVTKEQVVEAEKVVLEWIANQQEHIKQQQLSGSYYEEKK